MLKLWLRVFNNGTWGQRCDPSLWGHSGASTMTFTEMGAAYVVYTFIYFFIEVIFIYISYSYIFNIIIHYFTPFSGLNAYCLFAFIYCLLKFRNTLNHWPVVYKKNKFIKGNK